MAARPRLDKRGFGAEAPVPAPSRLAALLGERRGIEADLTTFRLLESACPQVRAGLDAVAGGGRFYADRLREAIGGAPCGVIRAEPHPVPGGLEMDARALAEVVRSPHVAMPAPSALGLTDWYFGDPAESGAAVRDVVGTLTRTMRDAGVAGHVLIADTPVREELEDLANPFTFVYCPDPDEDALDVLLDHQRPFALPGRRAADLAGLIDQYGRRTVYLVDPGQEEIATALAVLDADHLCIGGFCPGDCGSYWRRLAAL
ncbi:MAG: hypothetical protein GXY82_04760 [Methanospirillum sp.]|nr:hypothetical protein [Methanospirillum sp.]